MGGSEQMMRIAILAWGSLIWDRRDLPIAGDWQQGGPVVAIKSRPYSAREGNRVDASSSSLIRNLA